MRVGWKYDYSFERSESEHIFRCVSLNQPLLLNRFLILISFFPLDQFSSLRINIAFRLSKCAYGKLCINDHNLIDVHNPK